MGTGQVIYMDIEMTKSNSLDGEENKDLIFK